MVAVVAMAVNLPLPPLLLLLLLLLLVLLPPSPLPLPRSADAIEWRAELTTYRSGVCTPATAYVVAAIVRTRDVRTVR